MNVTELRNIYQLKISLNGARPPIWRRIMVSSSTQLEDLHIIFQICMGWMNTHLHQFVVDGVMYGEPDPDFGMDIQDEKGVRLSSLLKKEKDKMLYEYDFGDGWEHTVVLEKILPFDTKKQLPRCVTGRKACPPEDVGGIWGYEEFLEAFLDSDHPEHQAMKQWVGNYFSPDEFNKDEVNEILAEWSQS